MAAMPSGTVTFLFTDIQGSTRLWEHDAAAMWLSLERHNAVLHGAIVSHGGYHFKTVGDAYQAAFPDPSSALAAAVDAQRVLAAEPWAATGPILVRMAIHCGEAYPVGNDYLAPCLNRLARLLATGYGGQILLSEAVRRETEGALPSGVTFLALGRHRLRDLLEPEYVTQVAIAGLPDRFPPLKSLERHPTNLPIQPNPLVGRERELAEIGAMLDRTDVRLVTLTGMGGTGKTRLALQAAAEMLDDHEDGVFFVRLAEATDAQSVLLAIANELGIRQSGGESVYDAIVAYLAERQLLVLLDNFEQALEAAPVVSLLLAACPRLTAIVTSRARLGLQGEYEYPVEPLATPDVNHLPAVAALAGVGAVLLFTQRAAAASVGFRLEETNAWSVAAICARLDGLPLAIELAAARVKLLPLQAILHRLAKRLDLLTGGGRDLPERQRTLRATIQWSYGLLDEAQQTLFRRLAVFAGGFSLEAAGAVANGSGAPDVDVLDGVTALADHSLVRPVTGPNGEPRFVILETLREFGLERLEAAGDAQAVRQAHAAWFLEFTETAFPQLSAPDQAVWLQRLEAEHDNLRLALDMTVDSADDTGLRLAGALWPFWYIRGHLTEGRSWLERALAGNPQSASIARAGALIGDGTMAYVQGALRPAAERFEESLDLFRRLENGRGIAHALNNLGTVTEAQGDLQQAALRYEEALALFRELDDTRGAAIVWTAWETSGSSRATISKQRLSMRIPSRCTGRPATSGEKASRSIAWGTWRWRRETACAPPLSTRKRWRSIASWTTSRASPTPSRTSAMPPGSRAMASVPRSCWKRAWTCPGHWVTRQILPAR